DRPEFFRNRRTIVVHVDTNGFAKRFGPDRDRPIRATMLDRVADQVGEDLLQSAAIPHTTERRRLEKERSRGMRRAQLFDDLCKRDPKIHFLWRDHETRSHT